MDDPLVTWKVVDDVVVHTVGFDRRPVALRDTVGTAAILDKRHIRFTAVPDNKIALTLSVGVIDSHVWRLRSVAPNGLLFYVQGIEVATGKPALVDEQCEHLTS